MAVNGEIGDAGLSAAIVSALQGVFSRYPQIHKVLLFGSRAQGRHRPGSDIDLAVFAPTLSAEDFARLWNDIDELPIALKMDLVHFETLEDPEFKGQILRYGRPIYLGRAAA